MKTVDGNKAASKIAYLFSEVCAIYPITPSSPMAENIDILSHTDLKNLYNTKPKVVEMESEMGAAGALHGALLSGSLASTFTASQGLLLMIPNMYKIAGEMLPGVMHVASRSIATHALSIFGDHSDIYAARDTGWCILASSSVEDAHNLSAVAHLSSISSSLPFIHFFDGFRTSHELNTIEELKEEDLLKLIDKNALDNFKSRALITPKTYGTSQTEDVFFQCMEAKNVFYDKAVEICAHYMEEINKLTKRDYKPFNFYGDPQAEDIIVAMGSVCDTIKLVIDDLNKNGRKLGLIEVHLFRPFSKEYLKKVLPSTAKKIAVLDRAKEHGSTGEALYLDVMSCLKDMDLTVVGGRYGLSSKNTTPSQIKAVFDMLDSTIKNNFTIGINDDLSNTSLNEERYILKLNCDEVKIYGFGSDGMVSSSKSIMALLNEKKNKFVQGYFEYDSKKSGGVTVSHLRYSDNKINAPFYTEHPSLLVVTKDEYFKKFDMLNDIASNATILINTIKNEEEINDLIKESDKDIILRKNIKVLTINATKIAYENNIPGKISKIMEVCILSLLKLDNVFIDVSDSIKKAFRSKGEDIINNNINAIKSSLDSLKEISIYHKEKESNNVRKTIYDLMEERKGSNLSVKECLPLINGVLPAGLSAFEKRNVSPLTPKWDSQKCTQCGLCAFVCPHAVVRNFITKDKTVGIPLRENNEYNFVVGISNKDCTGCNLCANICPTKSLTMQENVSPTTSLFNNKNDELVNKFTIKGSSLCNPGFEFSGACAGCGETPYLKLLTSLFKDEIIIANATGCSSIYGASSPSTPYLIPWANSLFEDNAEFAYGINASINNKKEQIRNAINSSIDAVDEDTKVLFNKYLDNEDNYKITYEVSEELKSKIIPKEIRELLSYMPFKTVWAVGGDGWAYDIGYNGIDHILHSGENIKILVLDTEVYSNTGGQASKSSKKGAVCKFADLGKKTHKKDLFKIASSIDNVYTASISLGANMMQAINVFKEAEEHNGPSIIICYCPCIEHGIKGGMSNSIMEERLAVECGYVLLMRSLNGSLKIDSLKPNFDKYEEFLNNEVRFNSLKIKDENLAKELLNDQKEYAIKRYEEYIKKVNQ